MVSVKKPIHKSSNQAGKTVSVQHFRSRAESLAAGRALRDAVPHASHAKWKPPAKGHDPIAVLEESNQDRLPELVPIRYGRMLRSPFTFLRGSAALVQAVKTGCVKALVEEDL